MRRTAFGVLTLALLAALAVSPAAAGGGWSASFAFTDAVVIEHDCGIVEETVISAKGRAWFTGDGTWVRDTIQFAYASVIRSTVTGESIEAKGRQTATFTPETGALRGQGVFIRVGGNGVIVHDVGRLVFDTADGSTIFASARVIPFDDAEGAAAADAALCDLLG